MKFFERLIDQHGAILYEFGFISADRLNKSVQDAQTRETPTLSPSTLGHCSDFLSRLKNVPLDALADNGIVTPIHSVINKYRDVTTGNMDSTRNRFEP